MHLSETTETIANRSSEGFGRPNWIRLGPPTGVGLHDCFGTFPATTGSTELCR